VVLVVITLKLLSLHIKVLRNLHEDNKTNCVYGKYFFFCEAHGGVIVISSIYVFYWCVGIMERRHHTFSHFSFLQCPYTRDIVPTRRCKRVLQAVHISRGVKATEVYIACCPFVYF